MDGLLCLNVAEDLAPVSGFEAPEGLLKRYADEQKTSIEEAGVAFEECKKFLYLCVRSDEACVPSTTLDEMWHTFLMFSRSYRKFCEMLGGFIDHEPREWKSTGPYLRTLERAETMFGQLNQKYWPKKNNGSECEGGNCGLRCSNCNN